MADINFLPSDSKPEQKEEKKIRRVEYTNPELKKKQKSTQHGGILSIFSKKAAQDATTPPPPPAPPKAKPTEPQLTKKEEKKKQEMKTVITYQDAEKEEKKEVKPKKKKGFFSNLFSKSEKKDALPDLPLPPDDVPSYESNSEPEKKLEPQKEETDKNVSLKQPENQKSEKDQTPIVPPPPFSPFNKTSAPPPKPDELKKKNEVVETKPLDPPRGDLQEQKPVVAEEEIPKKPDGEQTAPTPTKPGLMFDVNLVPDELAQKKRSLSKLTWLGLVLVICIAFVGLSYFGIAFYKESVASEAERLEDDIERIRQQIKVLEPIQLDALVLQKRTEEISRLLDSHIYWTKFFEKLEDYTLRQVDITNLRADKDGTVTISAEASDPKYAYEQLRIFEQADDFVSSITMVAPSIPRVASEETQIIDEGDFLFPLPGTDAPGTTVSATSDFTYQIQLNPSLIFSGNSL